MAATTQRIRRVRPGSRKVAARVSAFAIAGNAKRADTSRQMFAENEFHTTAAQALRSAPLTPPYDPARLKRIVEESNMIGQCIAAYVTNIALCGMEVVPVHPDIPVDPDEAEELQSFIDNANADESLSTVRAKTVNDVETVGYGFEEVIRDRAGRVSILRHVKATTMRLCAKGDQYIPVRYDIRRGKRTAIVMENKQFRKFVQIVNGHTRYFKEFGDPRRMDYETGKYEGEEGQAGTIPEDKLATEIIHHKQGDDTYGVPRWINQLPSVLGSREAEEVNLRYFEDNTVPPMILSVAGGRLTAQSYNDLQRILLSQGVGRDRQHKLILIEAVPERESLDDKGSVSLKIDKLTDSRQSDGLFKDYDAANQAKVRSSFRLPPVAVGLSQDVTFATANVSAFLAESQVYAPERHRYDEVYNKQLVNGAMGLGLKTVMLASKVPSITNSQELIKSLTALNTMGALTPRMALEAANKILEIDLPMYPKKDEEGYESWMDRPIIFITRGTESQDGQAQKDGDTKKTEQDGDVRARQPENGSQ